MAAPWACACLFLTPRQEYTSGQLKVLVYHNSNSKVKTLKKKDLEAYDVIMISCELAFYTVYVGLL